jgi:hypothetical protein
MTTKKIVLIVGSVLVVLAALVTVFIGGIVGVALFQLGNSDAAIKAKDFLRNSEKLKMETGEVKDFGSIVTGSMNFQGGNGEATLNLKVIGEQKTVNASVHLLLVSGNSWRVSSASYENDSGQTIDLLDPFDSKVLIPLVIA